MTARRAHVRLERGPFRRGRGALRREGGPEALNLALFDNHYYNNPALNKGYKCEPEQACLFTRYLKSG